MTTANIKVLLRLLTRCAYCSLPQNRPWLAEDHWISQMHWAYDPGSADAALELAQALRSPYLLSRISRLVVDVNRPLSSETLIRSSAEGRAIAMNKVPGCRHRCAKPRPYVPAVSVTVTDYSDGRIPPQHAWRGRILCVCVCVCVVF